MTNPPPTTLLISSAILPGLGAAASELGIPLAPVLRQYGIAPELLENPQGYISRQAFNDCLTQLATTFDCPHLGLLVARHGQSVGSGILAQLIKASPTLGEALHNGYRHLRVVTETEWRMQVDAGFATLLRSVRHGFDGRNSQIQALSIGQHVKLLREILGEKWYPTGVYFSCEAPADKQHYRRFFGAPVYFNQAFDGLRFPQRVLNTPMPHRDPELLAIIKQHLASRERHIEESLSSKVGMLIRQQLDRGDSSMATIARTMGLHPKALQRALRREGQNYKQLLAQLRLDTAEFHLSSSGIELGRLADMLGYSCQSVLSRAFKQRHGVSPQRWRRQFSRQFPANAPT